MIKICQVFLLLMMCVESLAQEQDSLSAIDQKKWQTGLDLSLRQSKPDWSIQVVPEIGRIINKKMWIGIGIGAGIEKSNFDESNFLTRILIANPYLRYFFPIKGGVQFFLQPEGRLAFGQTTADVLLIYEDSNFSANISNQSDVTIVGGRLSLGVMVRLSNSWLLDLSISPLMYQKIEHQGSEALFRNSNNFYLEANFADIDFGVKFLF